MRNLISTGTVDEILLDGVQGHDVSVVIEEPPEALRGERQGIEGDHEGPPELSVLLHMLAGPQGILPHHLGGRGVLVVVRVEDVPERITK